MVTDLIITQNNEIHLAFEQLLIFHKLSLTVELVIYKLVIAEVSAKQNITFETIILFLLCIIWSFCIIQSSFLNNKTE